MENKVHGNTIQPRYIIYGDMDESPSGIEILISGVSEWIDQETDFEITDSEIKKEIPKSQFDETIFIDEGRYQVKTSYCCNIRKMEDRDFLVSEYTTVEVIKLDGVIDPSEAEKLSYSITTIFSLLLALPLSIEYVWLIDKEGRLRSLFYFPTPKTAGKPFEYPLEALIHPALISSNYGWKKIFENCFSSSNKENFAKIWTRLTLLFSYTDILDYEVLGYATVLDSYCDKYAGKKGKSLESEKYEELKRGLMAVIDNYAENLGSGYSEVMDGFRTGIKNIKNTSLATFEGKFEFMMKGIDSDLRSIVNFTKEEFSTVKKIRNAAAHGHLLKIDQRDISNEFRVKNKLLVLLMYLVYRDFGFSVVDYALSLKGSSNKFARNAELNRALMDKLTGVVSFYNVDEGSFLSVSNTSYIHVGLKHYRSNNTYKFSHSVTKESQKWWHMQEPRNQKLVDHIRENIDEVVF